jgi:light-regulated signal transduction histidine kinase (bacteriophytochrome)
MTSQRQHDYTATLRAYLKNPDESTLTSAYELGRTAIGNGTGVVDIVGSHAEALGSILDTGEAAAIFVRSISFLMECLAPLDMALRGFIEANRNLRALNADLERANRDLTSFAYTLAHDLRTPLRALAGYSAALTEDCADNLGAAGRDHAERIQVASEHMAEILDDMLQLAGISRTKIELQPVDLGALAASIAKQLQRQDPDRHVRFNIQQPVWALADRTLIRMVVQNLLDNAWKFTSGRDDASIDFGATGVKDDARICCYVRDNGAGFDPAYANKLFRPFQRLHSTREFSGTGIGLASARQIVERHGGRTSAQGAVGDGATFTFTLQAAEPK